MPITSTNPYTGEKIQDFDEIGPAELDAKLHLAVECQAEYRQTEFESRVALLHRAAGLLRTRQEKLARLAVEEMGKLIQPARDEVEKCAKVCDYYAQHGASYLAPRDIDVCPARAFVAYQPLGVVLAVMPWNFPYWQVFRFVAPALMAGNAGLLKHASNVPKCAQAIEDVLMEAGFPAGCFQNLYLSAQRTAPLLNDNRVAAVTLTGSEGAGSKIAEAAGRNIKKSLLELGGSDPFIVMPSADLKKAAETAVKARMINNGQSCIAAKRFIVHENIYDEFRDHFVAAVKALQMGDPMDETTTLGPLATLAIRDELHQQVQDSLAAGANLLCGGEIPHLKGFFYPGTVLDNLPEDAPIARDETFGPVAALFKVQSKEEAVEIANRSSFGLGSSVWTTQKDDFDYFVKSIEAGSVFVNAMVASDPRVPFGGIKKSGYGRELSEEGIREFTNVKTVWIA